MLAFLALALFGVPFPIVVALAGLAGWALGRWRPSALPQKGTAEAADDGPPPVISDDVLHTELPSNRRTLAGAARRACWCGACPSRPSRC